MHVGEHASSRTLSTLEFFMLSRTVYDALFFCLLPNYPAPRGFDVALIFLISCEPC